MGMGYYKGLDLLRRMHVLDFSTKLGEDTGIIADPKMQT